MRKLMAIAATGVVLIAGLAAVSCGGNDDNQTTPTVTLAPTDALPILKGVGDGLPRYRGLTVDDEYNLRIRSTGRRTRLST